MVLLFPKVSVEIFTGVDEKIQKKSIVGKGGGGGGVNRTKK